MNRSILDSESVSASDGGNSPLERNPLCPICGAEVDSTFQVLSANPNNEPALPAADNPFAGLNFYGCRGCGFGWGAPYVDSEKLSKFYRDVYYQKVKHRPGNENPKFQGFVPFDPRSVSQILLARMFRSFREGESVLDIGPGQGRSFRALSELIPGLKYFAFEPDSRFSVLLERFLGAQVFPYQFPSEPIASSLVEGRKFDLVLMSHVIEHFNARDVDGVLRNVRDLLSEDGILMCETPHCDWRQGEVIVNDPSHLALFTRDSLRLALTRAGFKVEFLNTCSQDEATWRSELNEQPASKDVKITWGRRIYESLPVAIQKRFSPRLYALKVPNQSARLLISSDFDYGGDRTCVRAIATIAGASRNR